MARQQFYTEASKKNFEVYKDFSGGINTTSAQDVMSDRELSDAVNVSLDERGSLKRRIGMKNHLSFDNGLEENVAQGHFRFYKNAYTFVELIARNGKLELEGKVLEIEGLPDGFQKERIIEGVQYYDKMYFATGTKLVQFDGEKAEVVKPHAPQPLEALYIGTNALADNPNNFLSDGVGPTLQVAGVTFSSRYGVMNEPFTLTAYHIQKAGVEVEYQFEYRYPFMEEGKWHMGQDWSSSKTWTHTAEGEGSMQFRINARDKGLEVASAQYLVPNYTVKPAPDPNDVEPDHSGIHTCNRILLHWGRLVMYGDTVNINLMYMSHLNTPNYFPMPNNLSFETTKRESITAVVRFRDHLVTFTDSSIQALFGKGPSDYRRVVLNTSVGCIAPRSAVVMDNYIVFLSYEGVYLLKSVGYVDDKANVSKLDGSISNIVHRDRDACAIVEDEQYHLVFPQKHERFRYYKSTGTWVRDKSSAMDLLVLNVYDNELYAQRKSGQVVQFDHSIYVDLGEVFPMIVESKYFDFGQSNHGKKLKGLQITASTPQEGPVARVSVFTDGVNNVSEDLERSIKFLPTEVYNTFLAKLKIKGRTLRTKVRIVHEENEPMQVLGLSFIFKIKKP